MSDLQAALAALKAIAKVEPPYGDLEGDAVNSDAVLSRLDPSDHETVIEAVQTVRAYIADVDGAPDQRAINTLNKHGYNASYSCRHTDQYGPVGCTGHVTAGPWRIDLSDEDSDD